MRLGLAYEYDPYFTLSIARVELDLYDQLTRYVEDQSIKAAHEDSARSRAVGFTMAMLQALIVARIPAWVRHWP